MDGLIVDWIAGYCPVQSEGMIDGEPYYFRARGNRWSMLIGRSAVTLNDDDGFSYSEPYGEEKFAAGWMTQKEAMECIEKAIGIYRERRDA